MLIECSEFNDIIERQIRSNDITNRRKGHIPRPYIFFICFPEYPGHDRAIRGIYSGGYFFISVAEGANGLTALNLVLPVYSIIFAIGNMIAVGSATRFRIYKAQGNGEADHYFTNAVIFCLIFSIPFLLIGLFFSQGIVTLLGVDAEILPLAAPYTRIFMLFLRRSLCGTTSQLHLSEMITRQRSQWLQHLSAVFLISSWTMF